MPHTPGPWKVHKSDRIAVPGYANEGPGWSIHAKPGNLILLADLRPGVSSHQIEEVTEANARLMASAPELLDALRLLTGFAATHDGDGCQNPTESAWADLAYLDLKTAVNNARKAIAKAEGRT